MTPRRRRSLFRRVLVLAVLLVLVACALPLAFITLTCWRPGTGTAAPAPEAERAVAGVPNYRREGAATRDEYAFDPGVHLMLAVIGVSFSGEQALRGFVRGHARTPRRVGGRPPHRGGRVRASHGRGVRPLHAHGAVVRVPVRRRARVSRAVRGHARPRPRHRAHVRPPLDLVFNLAKHGAVPMRVKWLAEKYVEPWLESCPVRRAQAQGQGEACLVPRNQPMHDSVRYLKNALPDETDVLQEYCVPRAAFVPFVDALRRTLVEAEATVMNASVRVVHREDHALTYAPADMFAIVLYLNQRTDAAGDARMRALTRRLIDVAADHGGRFFLPYQLHYTAAQLRRAYPEAARFFLAKRRWDPHELFTSTFYETYGR